MKRILVFLVFVHVVNTFCYAQSGNSSSGMRVLAERFLATLNADQVKQVQYPFDDAERFNWNFVPTKRNGIALKDMSEVQTTAAMNLLRSALSTAGFNKARAIIQLENVLRIVESRRSEDDYRDAGKYYITLFGKLENDSIWGWRVEGHHVALNFTSDKTGLVSGTPGFMGANPAIVQSGEKKGTEVLKEETTMGFQMLNSLTEMQRKTAIISATAPRDIITGNSRKAMIEQPQGIRVSELTAEQNRTFNQLLQVYFNRYREQYAKKLFEAVQASGFENVFFAWAGSIQPGPGNPHYYRIHGPTIIIEYDNTQNNANHIHTVVRDLKNDFGGDQLLEHYRRGAH